jgi:DNA mismatch endonuclease (patch repair protein)
MSRIRQEGTAPELVVRRMLRALAVPYRGNVRTLPGSPDIVLAGQKKAIIVHGCFWHRHAGCKGASTPKTRVNFWTGKFAKNLARDRKARRELNALGYSVMVVWECQAKRRQHRDTTLKRLIRFAKTIDA